MIIGRSRLLICKSAAQRKSARPKEEDGETSHKTSKKKDFRRREVYSKRKRFEIITVIPCGVLGRGINVSFRYITTVV